MRWDLFYVRHSVFPAVFLQAEICQFYNRIPCFNGNKALLCIIYLLFFFLSGQYRRIAMRLYHARKYLSFTPFVQTHGNTSLSCTQIFIIYPYLYRRIATRLYHAQYLSLPSICTDALQCVSILRASMQCINIIKFPLSPIPSNIQTYHHNILPCGYDLRDNP